MENEDIFSVEQEEEADAMEQPNANYSEDDIKTLDWKEHIRRRPGMYTVSYTHLTLPTKLEV